MIVFSSFVPYLPISPAINDQERRKKAKKTLAVFSHFKEELYARKSDFLALISLNENVDEKRIEISVADELKSDYSKIGDFESNRSFNGLPGVCAIINEELSKYFSVVLSHEIYLSFAESFAADNLLNVGSQLPIISIKVPRLENKEDLIRIGAILRDVIENLRKRVAVVFVGNLSHCASADGPAKFHLDGKKYDDKIKLLVKKNNLAGVLKLPNELILNSVETSFPQFIVAYGMSQEMHQDLQYISYEHPFGVGYLTVRLI